MSRATVLAKRVRSKLSQRTRAEFKGTTLVSAVTAVEGVSYLLAVFPGSDRNRNALYGLLGRCGSPMCLLLLALESHPTYRLVVAANRDELYERPAAAAAFWPENPSILAGRDLEAGGTWLGMTLDGRFAALTNFREPGRHKTDAPSRGGLVEAFLQERTSAEEYMEALSRRMQSYNGFSMLAWDGSLLAYCSNRDGSGSRALDPGLYGLSNGTLDEPWPKVTLAKRLLATALADPGHGLRDRLFTLLGDRTEVPDDALPRTGLPVAWERALSPIFVTAGRHGTRCSTVLLLDAEGRAEFEERSFSSDGRPAGRVEFGVNLTGA